MEQTKFTRFKRIVKENLLSLLIVLILLVGCCTYLYGCNHKENNVQPIQIECISHKNNITKIDTVQLKNDIQNKLINEVSQYVKTQASKSHQFIPKYLVQAGLNNNIDICFIMAQTQIETCYGTTGAGRESARRSLFGVIKKRYSNYEDAINHYCEILKKYYLVKGKSEQQLMVKYVTSKGGRYAENPKYETELKLAYNHIKRTTSIYSLQQEYKKF